jgi:hypothetical protein
MVERNLIIIHRGSEYVRDFRQISEKIAAIDPGIHVFPVNAAMSRAVPDDAWARPTLTVALLAKFKSEIRRGPVLANRAIHKAGQYRIFRKAGLPTPPTERFVPGMKLDPIVFGEYVVIKPTSPDIASQGRGIQLFRRRRLEAMSRADFPRDHLIHHDRNGFLVQRFVDTGPYIRMFRVSTLFGVPLYCWSAQEVVPFPAIGGSDEDVEKIRIASNAGEDRVRTLCTDPVVLELGARVGAAFPDIPILGTDIIPEEKTGKLYVLECNPGGNTWHFSSGETASIRRQFGGGSLVGEKKAEENGRQRMIDQFGAFDRAAEVLVQKVHDLAK